jgi:microcystin degradation protein MlrC
VVDVSVFGGFPYADSAAADGSILVWVDAGDAAAGDGADSAAADSDPGDGDAAGSAAGGSAAANGAAAAAPGDVATVGASTAGAPRLAIAIAAELIDAMAQRLPRFAPDLRSAADGLAEADRLIAAGAGPVAVTDPGDNPLSGGDASTTGLLRALLAARGWDESRPDPHVRTKALPAIARLESGRIAFAYFADAGLVDRARRAGVGAMIDAVLGAETADAFGGPVAVAVRVAAVTPGRFVNCGAMECGRQVECGASVVLEVLGIRIVVTSAVCPANDPAFFALHGIGFDRTRLLCVKAKNHFRAAFGERCAAIIDVDCPGPAAADLRLLPFRRWTADLEGVRP